MTDPKDITIREQARQIALLLESVKQCNQQSSAIADLRNERDTLMAENANLRSVIEQSKRCIKADIISDQLYPNSHRPGLQHALNSIEHCEKRLLSAPVE
jgi:hypothetical protein